MAQNFQKVVVVLNAAERHMCLMRQWLVRGNLRQQGLDVGAKLLREVSHAGLDDVLDKGLDVVWNFLGLCSTNLAAFEVVSVLHDSGEGGTRPRT